MTSVKDLIIHALKDLGYDGLFNADEECACAVEELCPCEGFQEDCCAGIKARCNCNDDEDGEGLDPLHDYHINIKKESVKDE